MRFSFILPVVFLASLALPALAADLPVETITITGKSGKHDFKVEVAADEASRELGLMYRKTMAPDAGMLFDFKEPQFVSFWMENTVLPLDMLFVRANGTIARIHANATPYSRESIPSGERVQLVIELNAGRAAALGIVAGDKVSAPQLDRKPRK